SELIKNGFGEEEGLNCAEKILYGANVAYKLGLDKEALKLSAAFGGGMAIEDKCGALTGALMVLGKLFVKEKAHESDKIGALTRELFKEYGMEMGYIDCTPLKKEYRSEEEKCNYVILKAAQILDKIVTRETHLCK
ncbi:MAG TPA: C-GCAxxG-C-C family (seleno)protein, partial [Clostridia bacterium]|nr:C-GCAxxG-C-C family (seleno)protein [Clostridia bacterium]